MSREHYQQHQQEGGKVGAHPAVVGSGVGSSSRAEAPLKICPLKIVGGFCPLLPEHAASDSRYPQFALGQCMTERELRDFIEARSLREADVIPSGEYLACPSIFNGPAGQIVQHAVGAGVASGYEQLLQGGGGTAVRSGGVAFALHGSQTGAWLYNFNIRRNMLQSKHLFQVAILRRKSRPVQNLALQVSEAGVTSEVVWECVELDHSPSFAIKSLRSQNRKPKDKGASPGQTTVKVTKQSKRRQWVRETMKKYKIKAADLVVENVNDTEHWEPIYEKEQNIVYAPPANVNKWSIEAGHFPAFFEYVKRSYGVNPPAAIL
jgi:hypothetical protein